jgi:hypothetical protein
VAKALGIRWVDKNCLKWAIKNVDEFKTRKGKDYKDLGKDD